MTVREYFDACANGQTPTPADLSGLGLPIHLTSRVRRYGAIIRSTYNAGELADARAQAENVTAAIEQQVPA